MALVRDKVDQEGQKNEPIILVTPNAMTNIYEDINIRLETSQPSRGCLQVLLRSGNHQHLNELSVGFGP